MYNIYITITIIYVIFGCTGTSLYPITITITIYSNHVFIPKGRFYAMVVIKYLMASFYTTASSIKSIIIIIHDCEYCANLKKKLIKKITLSKRKLIVK